MTEVLRCGNMSTIDETALIFEGGGMRAVVSAGVVVRLIETGLNFPLACGISAGATHTFNYTSRDVWRAENSFTSFVTDPNFGSWRTFVKGQGIFNTDYLYGEGCEPDGAYRFDFEAFHASPTNVRISAFCVDTASPVYWNKADMPDLESALRRAQASSTMPGFMPPVEIDGATYVDGALGPSGGIPLDAARLAGHERFVVVMTQPREYVKKRTNPAVFRALFHDKPAVADALANRWRAYNHTRNQLLELEKQGKAFLFFPEKADLSNRETDIEKLEEYYNVSLEQADRWIEELQEWLQQ
ncbi:MAG: patatin family protein [Actinomycetaceae bacterium]|nr:patatin family protein [Actinomycetaceae bacterium]